MARTRCVAFIGDVHANVEALRAVEEDALEAGVDRWIFCGDAVGLGPDPNEVLDWLQEHDATCVLGNVDWNVLRVASRQERYREPDRVHKFLSYGWTWNEMTRKNRLFLAGFKKSLRLSLHGSKSLVVHGMPGDLDGMLTPDFAETKGKNFLKRQGCEIFVSAHTHRPFVLETSRGWLANCGSVGIPRSKPGRATYVLARFDPGVVASLELRKVSYSPGAVARRFAEKNLPRELALFFTSEHGPSAEALRGLEPLCDDPRFVARMED